jgi:hypothetical protein
MPRVLEGGDLRGRLLAFRTLEEDVVVRAGIEGRVQVDEVYRLLLDVVSEDAQVVAEVEAVHF